MTDFSWIAVEKWRNSLGSNAISFTLFTIRVQYSWWTICLYILSPWNEQKNTEKCTFVQIKRKKNTESTTPFDLIKKTAEKTIACWLQPLNVWSEQINQPNSSHRKGVCRLLCLFFFYGGNFIYMIHFQREAKREYICDTGNPMNKHNANAFVQWKVLTIYVHRSDSFLIRLRVCMSVWVFERKNEHFFAQII